MPRAHIIQYRGCFYHWVDIHLMEEYYSPRVLPNSSQCFCTDMFFYIHFVHIYIDLYNISISWIWLSCWGSFGMFLLSRIFKLLGFGILIMSVPDESYSKNAICAPNSTSTLFSLSYCGSLIDHILCNTSETISKSGVIEVGNSDHFITFCTFK
jgi:hypothetical protein